MIRKILKLLWCLGFVLMLSSCSPGSKKDVAKEVKQNEEVTIKEITAGEEEKTEKTKTEASDLSKTESTKDEQIVKDELRDKDEQNDEVEQDDEVEQNDEGEQNDEEGLNDYDDAYVEKAFDGLTNTKADLGTEFILEKGDHTVESDVSSLESQIKALLATKQGNWSVYFKRMDSGESFVINDQKMVAASLIKLFVYGAVRQKIESGSLTTPYENTLRSMITVSDNTACNTLVDAVGGFDSINGFIQSIGCMNSQMNRKMLVQGTENYTSTKDCGQVLEMVLNGTYVSKTTSDQLLEALKSQTRTGKIPRGVPAGVQTANKTGELAGIENDAAIIFSNGGVYILCVMSENGSSGNQVSAIQEISSAAYQYMNP